MSIRTRFTLTYTLILALTLSIFGIALYSVQAQDTLNSLKDDLRQSANRFADATQKTSFHPVPPPNESNLPPLTFDKFSNEQEFQAFSERELVRILDENGNLVASPFGREGDELPLSEEGLAALKNSPDWWEQATISDEQMLIYSKNVTNKNDITNIIQVARPLTERNRTLQSLATTLIIAGLLTVIIAFGIGWFLSGLTLQPINRITQTAREIGNKKDFSQRVKHQGPNDEVGQLANTFNAMLERLQEAFLKVEHSLEMQRIFVADVSHELRTPLTTLRGNLGLLRRKPAAPEAIQEDIVKDMVEESDRLIRLVNDLLSLARADAGRSLANDPVDLTQLIEEICRQSNYLDSNRSIIKTVEPYLTILGDRDALKQILLIAIDNAIKHSSSDIEIEAFADSHEAQIKIVDQGEGIPKEILDHVFDRFYRGEEESTITGFGLGLSIAKALVEKQGGTISLTSVLGKGSQLILTFPIID